MAALRTAIEVKPPGMTIVIADISAFPLYNEDVRAQGFPPVVEILRKQIKAADALLFATPEYNYSMSGVLKNAIDWASRPPDQPFAEKPAAIMGAGAGMAGTAHAQGDFTTRMRLSRCPSDQQARGADRPGAHQVRYQRWSDRRRSSRIYPRYAGSARELDPTNKPQ